jgi:site-specific recombinase XerD
MRFLRGEQVVLLNGVFRREREVAKPSLSESVIRYEKWLTDDQGLSPLTVRDYISDLAAWLPKLGEDATLYDAAQIRDAAGEVLGNHSRGSHGALIRSMRSYLAFRAAEGHCSPDLVFSLISRPVYRLGTVPRHLDRVTINRVIDSCDPHTPVGIRDRSILLLLAELGLRATEVCGLQLEDVDWEIAELRIRGKGGRRAVMPLTQSAGDALFEYLAKSRPPSSHAAVFLRLRRPCVPFSSPGTISTIAYAALARCGIRGIGSAHVFRHSLATELLREGHDLQDVATVLRHQSLDTTLIYAKVDEGSLRNIATPWKGGNDD